MQYGKKGGRKAKAKLDSPDKEACLQYANRCNMLSYDESRAQDDSDDQIMKYATELKFSTRTAVPTLPLDL